MPFARFLLLRLIRSASLVMEWDRGQATGRRERKLLVGRGVRRGMGSACLPLGRGTQPAGLLATICCVPGEVITPNVAAVKGFSIKPDVQPQVPQVLRWLPYLYAGGAFFWRIELAQLAGGLAASNGWDQLQQALVHAGITRDVSTWMIVESAIVVLFEVTAAALHAAAYFGMKKLRLWGWICAVIVAGAWSLIVIGIPVLVVLLQRPTRRAFGMS